MDIKNYIQVFDNVLAPQHISSFIKWINKVDSNFEDATVIADDPKQKLQKSIRNTKTFSLSASDKSLTNVHWHNVLVSIISNYFLKYKEIHKIDCYPRMIRELGVLKYESGGFYKYHTDTHTDFPRQISTITLLNNDYEGGEIEFVNFGIKIKPEPGMLVLFPSDYAYAHVAHPVHSGTKYAIVTWMTDRWIQ